MKGIFWAKALYPARVFAVDFINGYLKHVHCLISMNSGQNIDKILMMRRRRNIWV
jgi:hypothetical protein